MTELLFFGLQIIHIASSGIDLDRDPVDDLQSVSLKADNLSRIIGQETNPLDTQINKDLRTDSVVSEIGLEAQFFIGLHCVESLVLKGIGLDFVGKADPPPLLAHIEDHTLSVFLDLAHGLMELIAAVTALGTEHISGQTFGVDSNQDLVARLNVSLDQGRMLLLVNIILVDHDPEITAV
jgi:hypothetical protein